MNYEAMSDFEVNAMVAKILFGPSMIDFECNQFPGNYGGFSYETELGYSHFNGCNNPSDAWPVIHDNHINMVWGGDDEWHARTVHTMRVYHKNPLRAAMIVFLMMQEEKCQKP